MPLTIPRKTRKNVPTGYAIGNGGCFYRSIDNNNRVDSGTNALVEIAPTKRGRKPKRKRGPKPGSFHSASRNNKSVLAANDSNGIGLFNSNSSHAGNTSTVSSNASSDASCDESLAAADESLAAGDDGVGNVNVNSVHTPK